MILFKVNGGFTLIEVMVALLIFAIGMLGLAGLQIKAHQTTQFAHTRTNITLNAGSLIDRMRSNMAGVTAGDYVYEHDADGDLTVEADCAIGNSNLCDATERATTDIKEWILEMGAAVPLVDGGGNLLDSAEVRVCRDGTPETQADVEPTVPGEGIVCDNDVNQWTIYIDWTDQRELTEQPVQRYTFTFIP